MSALPYRRPIGPVYINRNNYFGSRVLAYWPLDGTQLFDYASPSPGSVSGTNGAGSSSNNSRYFKGDGSSYVVLPKSPFKDNTSPVSIAFFQRRDAAALYDGLFSTMPPGASSRFCLGWGSDAAYQLFVGSSSSSIPSIPIAQP